MRRTNTRSSRAASKETMMNTWSTWFKIAKTALIIWKPRRSSSSLILIEIWSDRRRLAKICKDWKMNLKTLRLKRKRSNRQMRRSKEDWMKFNLMKTNLKIWLINKERFRVKSIKRFKIQEIAFNKWNTGSISITSCLQISQIVKNSHIIRSMAVFQNFSAFRMLPNMAPPYKP